MVNWMSITTRNNIVLFLIKIKISISKQGIEWVPRIFDGILELEINLKEAVNILQNLTPADYYRGPSPDFNGDGTMIWEFIYEMDSEKQNIPIYIKLKFQNDKCKVLSFHRSRKPYFLPYKD